MRIGTLALCMSLGIGSPNAAAAQSPPPPGETSAAEPSHPSWRAFGQYRFRAAMDRNRRSAPDRERIRLRLRLGAEVELMEGLSIGARLSTAPDPEVPNSPYIDLGDGFEQARIALDRLYIRWDPRVGERNPLTLWGGKFPNPLAQPAHYSELLWDADVHPEGLAATFEPVPALRLTAGGFSLLGRGNGSDVNVAALQAALRVSPGASWTLDAALGGYFYGDVDASAATILAERNRGNAVVRDESGQVIGFASGFDIWQAHGSLAYTGLGARLEVAGEYLANASAASGTDGSGFAVSGSVGGLGSAGTFVLDYRYQDVGQESVFSSLAQDDFLDATRFEGHIVGGGWQFLPFARVRAWTLWSRQPGEEGFQRRFRVDLDVSWSTS